MAQGTKTELRAMVREILKEVLAAKAAAPAPASAPVPVASGDQTVRIATDAELRAFVAHLARPGVIESVREGRLRFTLAPSAVAPEASQPSPAPEPARSAAVTLEGVVSERRLQAVPRGGLVLLAPGAVLTPLARDMVRRMSITVRRHEG
jgi:hypothetical protein